MLEGPRPHQLAAAELLLGRRLGHERAAGRTTADAEGFDLPSERLEPETDLLDIAPVSLVPISEDHDRGFFRKIARSHRFDVRQHPREVTRAVELLVPLRVE